MVHRPLGLVLDQVRDRAQEVLRMLKPLGIEGVGNHTARDMIPGLVCAAHGQHEDFGKAAAQDREKLESRHLGHVEIGDDEFRIRTPELQKSIEAVRCETDGVPMRGQQHCEPVANVLLVVHNQNAMALAHGDHLWGSIEYGTVRQLWGVARS